MWSSKQFIGNRIGELRGNIHQQLHIVQFNDTPASSSYIRKKLQIAQELSVPSRHHRLLGTDEDTALVELRELVHLYPTDGFVIQLPLPENWNARAFLDSLSASQDIDVLSSNHNVINTRYISPIVYAVTTALGNVIDISTGLVGRAITLYGHGLLVGRPVHAWLQTLGIAPDIITNTTSDTERRSILKSSDIIIAGSGSPWSITPSDITAGVILIDCGTALDTGVLKGDCHPDCDEIAQFMTKTPGGIGPLTVLGIFENMAILKNSRKVTYLQGHGGPRL